jgi:hypothetical protein
MTPDPKRLEQLHQANLMAELLEAEGWTGDRAAQARDDVRRAVAARVGIGSPSRGTWIETVYMLRMREEYRADPVEFLAKHGYREPDPDHVYPSGPDWPEVD